MEAIDFLKEAQRMCKEYRCSSCPVGEKCVLCILEDATIDSIHDFVSAIEQWSKDHPIMTNAQKFKEVFGEKTIDQLALCETRTVGPNVPKLFTKPSSWWDEPYKEP